MKLSPSWRHWTRLSRRHFDSALTICGGFFRRVSRQGTGLRLFRCWMRPTLRAWNLLPELRSGFRRELAAPAGAVSTCSLRVAARTQSARKHNAKRAARARTFGLHRLPRCPEVVATYSDVSAPLGRTVRAARILWTLTSGPDSCPGNRI